MSAITRRHFVLGLAATASPTLGLAQTAIPGEGKQYLRLAQALPTTPGKIEVFEFFLYTCPHCYALDAPLSAWVKQLPADVGFRRIHVGAGAMHKLHQRLMFALEALGRMDDLHPAVFKAIHVQHLDLSDEKAIEKFAVSLGLDAGKFNAAFNSFSAQSRLNQSLKLADAYRVETVPALGIGGRFLTSPSMAGGVPAALALSTQLIQQLRAGKT